MKKNWKTTLTVGSIIALVNTPFVFLACGKNEPNIKPSPITPKDSNVPIKKPDLPIDTSALANNLKINDKEFVSDIDAFYLMKKDYKGDVIDIFDEDQNDGIVQLNPKTSVMLQKGDALTLVFNENATDSLNIENFYEKIFLKNELLIPEIVEEQAKTNPKAWEKVQSGEGDEKIIDYFLKFTNGHLADKNFGSLLSSSHYLETREKNKTEFLKKMQVILSYVKKNYDEKYYKLILKHFKMRLVNGNYQYLEDFDAESTAGYLDFMPFLYPQNENLFKYEKIAKNAVKFTYNGITQSLLKLNFVLKNRDDKYKTLFKMVVGGAQTNEFNIEEYSKDNERAIEEKYNFVGSYNARLNTEKGKSRKTAPIKEG